MNKKEALAKFTSELAEEEGGKSQIKIGDIRQILKMIDKKLNGLVYAAIQLQNVKK